MDPAAWVKLVGDPMRADVEGLKRAFWWGCGGCGGAGLILGLLAPFILRKLGLA